MAKQEQKAFKQSYSDGTTILSNVRSKVTNQNISYFKTTVYADGTPMTDAKVDGDIYKKEKSTGDYYVQALDLTKSRTLAVNSVADLRNLSRRDIILIQLGYYNSYQTLGYYGPGDGGGFEYQFNPAKTDSDDGFLFIKPTLLTNGRFQPLLKNEINVKIAGARTGSLTDNKSNIEKAANASFSSNIPLIINEEFLTSPIEFPVISMRGGGILKLHQSTTAYDTFVNFTGDGSLIDDITFDSNKSVVTATGRREGVRVGCSNSTFTNVKSLNTPDSMTSNGFEIRGDNNFFIRCLARDLGYAGFAVKEGSNTFIDCLALDWKEKGFICNANTEFITWDGCRATTVKTPEEGANESGTAFLVDTGLTNKVKEVNMIRCKVWGASHVVDCKIVAKGANNFPDVANISDSDFLGSNPNTSIAYSLWTMAHLVNIRNVRLAGVFTDAGNDSSIVNLTNFKQANSLTMLRSKVVNIDNMIIDGLNNDNGAIRLYGNPTGQIVNAKEITFDSLIAGQKDVFWVSSGDEPKIAKLKVGNINMLRGRRLSTLPTLNNRAERLPRIFNSDTIPTAGDYIRGDVIYKVSPTAVSEIGFICIAGGNPGIWRALEPAASLTARGVVNQAAPIANVIIENASPSIITDATDLETVIGLLNDIKSKYNTSVLLINELKAKLNAKFTADRAGGQQAT